MNPLGALTVSLRALRSSKLAAILMLSILFWATGAPSMLNRSQAASFYDASDTLTDSDLSVVSGHTFTFSVPSRISTNAGGTATGTIAFDFDPSGNSFEIGQLGAEDFSATSSITVVSNCTLGGAATNKVLVSTTTELLTLSLCANNFIATSTAGVSFFIASTSGPITNPSVAGSYDIHISSRDQGQGTDKDTIDVQVAIIDDVVVTASVDTTFSFAIAGLPSGVGINGTTTSVDTSGSAQTLPFGSLTSGVPKVVGQRLNVTTNASNGFTVTVKADQTLTSSNGDTIDVFADGNGTTTPSAWTAPTGTFGSVNTYGHWGLTSDDDINANEFGTSDTRYAGNFSTSTRAVFSHTGPANGTTANIGSTTVAYAIQTTAFQEAGDDYTATLTYVATPVF